MLKRVARITAAAVLALVLVGAGLVWMTTPSARTGELLLRPSTRFTKDTYFGYVSPWGGLQMWQTRAWSRIGDHMVVNWKHFPAKTRISWRWPPFAPTNGAGVWGYNFAAYGNYADTPTETPVAPIRVRDLKVLRQTFRWSITNRWGDADVLTEFFLRANQTDEAAHRLEVGWFLHTPPSIRAFFEKSRMVGQYRDPSGREWTVRISERYCMFAPKTAGDLTSGEIDMLHALRWLQSRGLVKGDEWLWGLAIGAEPITGLGELTLHDWNVKWE
jgi:hypothetical protein